MTRDPRRSTLRDESLPLRNSLSAEKASRFVRLCDAAQLPRPPELNASVAGHEADCVYRAARLIVELDGRAYHERRAQQQADLHRDADSQLAASGSCG